MSESAQVDQNQLEFYRSMGNGMFAGLLAAGISHWISGQPIHLIMLMIYGLSLYRQLGWKELCALLSMIGTVVAYFAVYESFKLDSGLIVSIGLSLLTVVLFAFYLTLVAAWATEARAKALARKHSISLSKARALPISRREHWLEPTFADMRAKKATGSLPIFMAVRPTILVVAFLLLEAWIHNTLLEGVVAGVVVFQSIVVVEMLRYLVRLNQRNVDVVLATDPRPPILFLRSFALDELPVDSISDGWRGVVDMILPSKLTFEERLKGAFDDIGPLIAIGRPREDLGPLGAAREYIADNASWQQRVLERADVAQFVIMELDATPGMEWEIENVSKRVGLRRTVIVLPPGKDIYEQRPPEWYERWAVLRNRFSFLPEVTKDTVAVLFDADDRPYLVSSRDSSVQKQLAAIKHAWLENVPPQEKTIL